MSRFTIVKFGERMLVEDALFDGFAGKAERKARKKKRKKKKAAKKEEKWSDWATKAECKKVQMAWTNQDNKTQACWDKGYQIGTGSAPYHNPCMSKSGDPDGWNRMTIALFNKTGTSVRRPSKCPAEPSTATHTPKTATTHTPKTSTATHTPKTSTARATPTVPGSRFTTTATTPIASAGKALSPSQMPAKKSVVGPAEPTPQFDVFAQGTKAKPIHTSPGAEVIETDAFAPLPPETDLEAAAMVDEMVIEAATQEKASPIPSLVVGLLSVGAIAAGLLL